MDKDKQISRAPGIQGEEKTSIKSEKKEKSWDGYVCIYECRKYFCTSTFERAWAEQGTTNSKIKNIVDMWKSDAEK